MSKPTLYYIPASPPSRFALITANHIGLDVEIKSVNLAQGEQFSAEYKAINPTSTVPTLVDGDTKIFDSNAIAIYMIEKYGKKFEALYPNDLAMRTKVNEKLFYIASYMFPRGLQIFFPVMFGQETVISQDKLDGLMRGYGTIEIFLTGNEYLTGDSLRLCDLSLWCLMESAHQVVPVDEQKFPNFIRWLKKMREEPTYSLNKDGADMHVGFYRQCLARNIAKQSQ